VVADDRLEVGAVVGDQSASLLLGDLEEIGVAEAPQAGVGVTAVTS
jgi:hypothetical protein